MSVRIRALIEPRSSNEDARRREYILNIILAGSILALIFFDGLVAYYAIALGNHPGGVSIALFSILPAFFIFLYALSRRGFFVLASYLLIAVFFMANSYAVLSEGANLPTALLGYALVIVMASILIGTQFSFWITGILGIYLLIVWHFQLSGILMPFHETRFTDGDAITLVVLYGLIMIVAWLSNREIEKSLARARRSERELKEERDLLEIKVEQRTRELHVAEVEKIDHLYRFAEFGQLASGLFHDLLNILQSISLRVEQGDAAGNGATDDAQKLLENAFSVQSEIDRFRDAFRKQLSRDVTAEKFSLAASVEDVCQLLSYQAKRAGVHLEFERYTSDAAYENNLEYFGSPLKFHQVIMNLVLNAIESFEGVSRESGDVKRVIICLMRERDDIVVTVADNGSGIPIDLRAKIFDPFFTTKHVGKQGTGIGLAITKRIVENDFQGSISVQDAQNAKNNGVVLTVRFPLLHEPVSSHRGNQGISGGHRERTIT